MSKCCVVGCSNYKVKSKNIKFYTFPSRPWEKERRLKWIRSIGRVNADGSTWVPAKTSRVCSAHFVGGAVSTIENHPAYIPTIFPPPVEIMPSISLNLMQAETTSTRTIIHSHSNQKFQTLNNNKFSSIGQTDVIEIDPSPNCENEDIIEIDPTPTVKTEDVIEIDPCQSIKSDDVIKIDPCRSIKIDDVIEIDPCRSIKADDVIEIDQCQTIKIDDVIEIDPNPTVKTEDLIEIDPCRTVEPDDMIEIDPSPTVKSENIIEIDPCPTFETQAIKMGPPENLRTEVNREIEAPLVKNGQQPPSMGSMRPRVVLSPFVNWTYSCIDLRSKSSQACFDHVDNEFVFSSQLEPNEHSSQTNASVQCNIVGMSLSSEKAVAESQTAERIKTCTGFHGIDSLNRKEHFTSLCCVSEKKFHFITELMPANLINSMSNANALLLFLMKMKLGLSFSVLGLLFNVHRTTAARIFVITLRFLINETEDFFFVNNKPIKGGVSKPLKTNRSDNVIDTDCEEMSMNEDSVNSRRKFLLALNPSGFICFKSKCYDEKVDDEFILSDCGISQILKRGDWTLTKGCILKINIGKFIIIVAPLHARKESDRKETNRNSGTNVLDGPVLCSIRRIKMFQIFESATSNLFDYIDDITHMACVLSNEHLS